MAAQEINQNCTRKALCILTLLLERRAHLSLECARQLRNMTACEGKHPTFPCWVLRTWAVTQLAQVLVHPWADCASKAASGQPLCKTKHLVKYPVENSDKGREKG